MTNELDFIEINKHDFRVLIRPMSSIPFKKMLPIIDLSSSAPDSPQLFSMMAQLFTENLPVDKIEEFESMSVQQATDIIAEWMNADA